MESSSFYLTLPSNASMDIYPTNRPQDYQIRMPRTMYLPNKWEVALAEIHYPHTWTTFRMHEDYYIFFQLYPDGWDNSDEDRYVVNIPYGYYRHVRELIDAIHSTVMTRLNLTSETDLPFVFKFDKITRKVLFKQKGKYAVLFSQGLAEILGFIPYEKMIQDQPSKYPSDIHHGFNTLYIYCNICEPQVVGDYYVPLLRTVPITGTDGDYVVRTYGEPHYVPVNSSKFDTIEINIKDDTGRNVLFNFGKVICKLHFRQKAF